MNWEQAKAAAELVKSGKSRSNVQAAKELAEFVLEHGAALIEDRNRLEREHAALTDAMQRSAATHKEEPKDEPSLQAEMADLRKTIDEYAQFIDKTGDINATVAISTEGLNFLVEHGSPMHRRAPGRADQEAGREPLPRIRRFHEKFGHLWRTPQVPDSEQVFRLKLFEEFVFLTACLVLPPTTPSR